MDLRSLGSYTVEARWGGLGDLRGMEPLVPERRRQEPGKQWKTWGRSGAPPPPSTWGSFLLAETQQDLSAGVPGEGSGRGPPLVGSVTGAGLS